VSEILILGVMCVAIFFLVPFAAFWVVNPRYGEDYTFREWWARRPAWRDREGLIRWITAP
jgi:hypothetical protein